MKHNNRWRRGLAVILSISVLAPGYSFAEQSENHLRETEKVLITESNEEKKQSEFQEYQKESTKPNLLETTASEIESLEEAEFESKDIEKDSSLELINSVQPAQEETEDVVAGFVDTKEITGISDADFYGEYDRTSGIWTKPGYFDYEAHPEMAAVQEAVMMADGDYTQVKEAVMQYYLDKRNGYKLPLYGSTGVQQVFLAQALERNLYPHLSWKVLGFKNVTPQGDYVDFDVSYQWEDIKKLVDKKVTFYVMATRKDGTMAEIDSKQGEHPPVLEIESNGVVTSFPVSEDATVIAGSNDRKNYGNEPVLRIEESQSTIGAAEPTDSETKRALIKFDLSEWNMNDTVTRATLKLYGRNVIGDGEKEILVMRVTENNWDENKVTFANYEHMAYSWDGEDCIRYMTPKYSGHRYREEEQRFESVYPLIGGMFVQGETNQEYYAYIALKLWVGWLYQAGTSPRVPPADKAHTHSLDIGCRGIEIPNAMAWFITSEHMTPEIYSATLKHLWLAAKDMTDTGFGMNGSNNVATVGIRGLHTINTYFDEFRIHKDAQARVWQMQNRVFDINLIRPDGAYSEGSLVYATMAASNIITLIAPNEVTGSPDLPFEDPELLNQVEDVALYVMKMSAPGFKDSQWGDSGNAETRFMGSLKSYAEKFDNPYLNYYTELGTNRAPFPFTSCKYDSERRIALRSGWGENDVFLYTDMDGGSVSHAHKDDNAIILSAYGRYMLADPLYASYSDSMALYGSTGFHNTVEIDGTSQNGGGKGEIKYWETNNVYDNTSNWSKSYRKNGTNEYHVRNILYVRPGFFLVSDYLKPYQNDGKTHTYKQRWIMTPDAEMTVDSETMTARSNTPAMPNIQVVQADKENITLEKVNDRYVNTRSDRAVYTKETAGPVVFDTVLYPHKADDVSEVTSARIPLEDVKENGASASEIRIENPENKKGTVISYYIVHDLNQKTIRKFGNYETDARLAYVERSTDGILKRLILQDGSYVKDLALDKMLFFSKEDVSQFGCILNQGSAEIASSAIDDLSKLTLYADTGMKVSNVTFNEEKVEFKCSGRYVYFGNQPIVEDDEVPEPTRPPQSSGGGGGGGGVNRPGSSIGGGSSAGNYVPPAPTTTVKPEAVPTEKPSESYKDELDSFWGKDEVSQLIDHKILQGKDGRLALEESITRAEFSALLVRAMNWEISEYQPESFTDVQSGDWYADVIQTALDYGAVNGYPNKSFMPDTLVNREEMARMLCSALELEIEISDAFSLPYMDAESVSQWVVPYVAAVSKAGLMQGDENKRFNPGTKTTRGEAAVVIWRLWEHENKG